VAAGAAIRPEVIVGAGVRVEAASGAEHLGGPKKIYGKSLINCPPPWIRVRNQCCGSAFFPSWILDPNFFIQDPGSASKNLSILTQKIVSKLSEI
jgi:hypothetical protein